MTSRLDERHLPAGAGTYTDGGAGDEPMALDGCGGWCAGARDHGRRDFEREGRRPTVVTGGGRAGVREDERRYDAARGVPGELLRRRGVVHAGAGEREGGVAQTGAVARGGHARPRLGPGDRRCRRVGRPGVHDGAVDCEPATRGGRAPNDRHRLVLLRLAVDRERGLEGRGRLRRRGDARARSAR